MFCTIPSVKLFFGVMTTVSCARLVPVGWKITVMVQLPPGARLVPQSFVWLKRLVDWVEILRNSTVVDFGSLGSLKRVKALTVSEPIICGPKSKPEFGEIRKGL